ncbi:hypothetical protein HZC21_04560 [Candidatus Peregrinibacteria bacterium]|nr:hypothetical protein [Candidatus Peregrinibacteria bacterium]
MDAQNILKDFGLSEPEIKVYLASLELGSQPASIIAKKAGLKRGHTYNMLERMIQKGIVQEFTKHKVRYFNSRSPATFMSILEHRQDELKKLRQGLIQVIPDLQRIFNPLLLQPKARFFQGVEGIKEIYEDTIRVKNQNIYGIGDFEYYFPEQKNKELNEWIWNYADRRAKKNIWYIGIVNKSYMSDLAYRRRKKQKRKLKMLKAVYLPVEINIYGNKVAIASTYRDMVGLIIEDAPIAENLKNFHQSIWKFLPDYKIRG